MGSCWGYLRTVPVCPSGPVEMWFHTWCRLCLCMGWPKSSLACPLSLPHDYHNLTLFLTPGSALSPVGGISNSGRLCAVPAATASDSARQISRTLFKSAACPPAKVSPYGQVEQWAMPSSSGLPHKTYPGLASCHLGNARPRQPSGVLRGWCQDCLLPMWLPESVGVPAPHILA